MPLAIFLLIAGITILSIFSIERGEDQRGSAQLRSRETGVASALERRANASSAYLRAGAALLASLHDVPADQFSRFVSELRLDADYRGAEGIGWAPVVQTDAVDAFEAHIRAESGRSFTIHPRPGLAQSYLVPVTYLYPDTERNRRALGFDMYSEVGRRAAMREAERTSRPTATRRIVLRQEASGQSPGFLIYMPVFEAAPGGRRLKGFIYSPFNAGDFLASALELEDAGNFAVRLYDGNPESGQLLASSGEIAASDSQTVRQTISIANSPWVLQVSSAEAGGLSGCRWSL